MNLFKKMYCRIFQAAFHLALPILPYREPEILGSVGQVADLLKKLQIKSVLLVTDGALRKMGSTAFLEKSLAKAGIKCAVYDGTCPNPTVHNVEAAREIYVKENCKALIAAACGVNACGIGRIWCDGT